MAIARTVYRARWVRATALAVVLAVFPLMIFCRLRLRDTPLERDEGEYAYAGQLMLQAIPPYSLAYNMKLPGTYAAYAVIMAIFGQTASGIRIGLLLVNAATVLLLFFLGRRLLSRDAGLAAAAFYAVLSFGMAVMGQAAHATQFVVLPGVAGLYLLLRALQSSRYTTLFWSGVLFGVAFLMKQHGLFFALAGALWLVWKRPDGWPRTVRRLSVLAAAVALPFLVTCLALWWAGVFPRFWFWTFHYAGAYASENSLRDGLDMLKEQIPSLLHDNWPIWTLAAVGFTVLWWKRESRSIALFLTALLALSALAVCPGWFFRDHYFVLMLPAVALLAGAAAFRYGLPLVAAALVLSVILQSNYLFRESPVAVAREIYELNPFPEAIPAAAYIRAHSSPSATVAVIGSEPEIYFYSHRHSATGYIYTYALTENQPYAAHMRQEMIHEIERAAPEFIVQVNAPVFAWWPPYAAAHYQMVWLADIVSSTETDYREGASNPESDYYLAIYRRR